MSGSAVHRPTVLQVVELSINTLARILKVTQFHAYVDIVCESGQPVRLKTKLGDKGAGSIGSMDLCDCSYVDVFIQPDRSVSVNKTS